MTDHTLGNESVNEPPVFAAPPAELKRSPQAFSPQIFSLATFGKGDGTS